MVGGESHTRRKKLRNSKLGKGVLLSGTNKDKTSIQTKSFITNNVYDNEKYIYQLLNMKLSLHHKKSPPKNLWATDNAVYCSIKPLHVNCCCKTLYVRCFGVCGLCRYSIILSPKQINKLGITLEVLLKQSKIIVWSLTLRGFGVLKDSVTNKLWIPESVELVEENTSVLCFIKPSKIPFREMLS